MKVAILITDGGDGSASLTWFKDLELAQTVVDTDDWCETFGLNEGSPTIIEVQDDFVNGTWSYTSEEQRALPEEYRLSRNLLVGKTFYVEEKSNG